MLNLTSQKNVFKFKKILYFYKSAAHYIKIESTGSRRSSFSGFKDLTLANLESELLNTSFTRLFEFDLYAKS